MLLCCDLYSHVPVLCPALMLLLLMLTGVHAVLGVSALLSMLMHAMVNAKHELSACTICSSVTML